MDHAPELVHHRVPRQDNGVLGRSNGCITVDPVDNNQLVTRLQDGALVYVTVGDAPIEQYL